MRGGPFRSVCYVYLVRGSQEECHIEIFRNDQEVSTINLAEFGPHRKENAQSISFVFQ
jgi:hypothetical protein